MTLNRVLVGAGFVLAAGSLVALYALIRAPYSTSLISAATFEDLRTPPTPDFHVGPIVWSVSELARAPALEPFREVFHASCGGRTGLDAALCVSEAMARTFPSDTPAHEFLEARFDPAAELHSHLAGAPGNCVTRAGILAAELLSVGIPARVVQIIPKHNRGHHVVEVWDGAGQWVLVDPSLGAVLTDGTRPISVAAALSAPASVRDEERALPAKAAIAELRALYSNTDVPMFGGDILYPEPWLYVRTGERSAFWPFRGAFARVGAGRFDLGPQQTLLRALAAVSASLSFLAVFTAVALTRRRRRLPAAPAPAPAARAPVSGPPALW